MSTENSAPAETPDIEMPTISEGGSVEDILEELGLEPEAAGGQKAKPAAKPKDDAEAKEKDGKDGEKQEAAEEDPDVVEQKAILARSRQRRQAKEARNRELSARSAPQPKTEPEKAAADAKPAAKPEAPKPSSEAREAVRDVLLALDKLAGDDAAAGSAAAQGADAKAARDEVLSGLREKIDGIAKGLEAHETGLKTEVETLKQTLVSLENQRFARTIIGRELDAIETDIPSLMDPAKLRELKRADGSRYRDPIDVVYDAASKFHDKYGVTPNLKILARNIEKKLKGASPEKNADEKQPQSRKTVSSSLGSPPAARTGPDTRSKQQVEDDLWNALGIDPHG